MDRKKEVEERLKESEIREVNIVNNKIENNRKIRKYSGKRNKRQGKSGNKAVENYRGEAGIVEKNESFRSKEPRNSSKQKKIEDQQKNRE